MTVGELLDLVDGDESIEIRLATQPSYPFEWSVEAGEVVDGILYLAEGSQLGYLPGEVRDALSWR